MPMLNADDTMIERMELDLVAKTQAAYTRAGLSANIHGVFSVDDLESKTESDLCKKIAVGIGYLGALPIEITTRAHGNQNVDGGRAVKSLAFRFNALLAVPTGVDCTERYDATKLLTILRRGIIGSRVDGDITSRTWAFVKEFPNISESTESMLYYSQVWEVVIPERGMAAG